MGHMACTEPQCLYKGALLLLLLPPSPEKTCNLNSHDTIWHKKDFSSGITTLVLTTVEFSPSYTAYMQHYNKKCMASKSSRKYDLLLKWLPKKISLAVLTRMFTQHMLLQVEFKFWFLRTIWTMKLWFFSTFQPHMSQKSFLPFVSSPTYFTRI